MAEHLYTGLVSKQLRGNREDALTLEREARIKVGYLFDSMLPGQTFKSGSWPLGGGRRILAFVWNDKMGKRATVRLTGIGGTTTFRTYIMEDGWLAWELVPTGPDPEYPEYPLTLYSPYYLSHEPSKVWINNTAPAVPNIEPRKYTGLTRLLAQAMVGAKRAWSEIVPVTFSTSGNVLGIQRGPDMEYWLFNASSTQGVLAVKLEVPTAGLGYRSVLLDSNALETERHEAEARLFGTIELPVGASILTLMTPEDYVAAVTPGPLHGGWHWMYQQGYLQSRSGAIAVHLTQTYDRAINGGFKSQEHRLVIGWDEDNKPTVTVETEIEQKWLHYRSNLHLWVGFGSQWDEVRGTIGGNMEQEGEYIEGDANIYARYDLDDSVIYTGITGSRKTEDGVPAPVGADEANTFLQQIVFCGGTGGGTIGQTVISDKYTSQRWWDKEYAAGPDIQSTEEYSWSASGGARVEVLSESPTNLGDPVDIVNCDGTYTRYEFDDGDPQTNIWLNGRWDATPGQWNKTRTLTYPQGYTSHIFFGDDVEMVCIIESETELVEDLYWEGTLGFHQGVGSIIYKGAERIDHFVCQIYGYGYWPDPNGSFICRDTVAVLDETSGEELHQVNLRSFLRYNWPGGSHTGTEIPSWGDQFSVGTLVMSGAPYMNSSYGGLAVTTDYIPPGLEPEGVDNFGCWEGGT